MARAKRNYLPEHPSMWSFSGYNESHEDFLNRLSKLLSETGTPCYAWVLIPKELLALGIREYREIFSKPYRIICRVLDKNVYVLLIVDGRRDMQKLVPRRLLGA